jgi:lipopolysaccharide transport system ATP-binding protein
MPPIITVQNVGKRYRLGRSQTPYSTLREALVRALRSPLTRFRSNNDPAGFVWAIEDVSFTVNPGEIVGIIGRNGAGKSTLLKMLSRITEPTRGKIQLYGRVGSLLEVGTGFHPELTGRENIYLNGAILGMTAREIGRNFDEIVAFAEVEKFIDTPVKHYSSGMYLRLAFAVAAHLEPEILLVDEVLAVGDARFQRKCLDKMQDVAQHGRTVLFVSHNMPAITRLCPRTILLDQGRVLRDGPSHQVVSVYLKSGLGTTAAREWTSRGAAPGNNIVRLCAVRVRNHAGEVSDALDIRQSIQIETEYEVLQPGYELIPDCQISNDEGLLLFVTGDQRSAWGRRPKPAGRFISTVVIPGNFLAEGTMFVAVAMSTMEPQTLHYLERDAVAFQVIDSMDGDSARGDYAGPMGGVVRPRLQWETRHLVSADENLAVTAEIQNP